MRLMLATAATLLALAGPAMAWNYSERETDMDLWISAYQDNDSGYQLALSCSDWMPDDADITIYSPEDYDETTSYASEVPLTVTVDGLENGPLTAKFANYDGKLSVTVYESDDDRVRPLFELIRKAKTGIEISYFDTKLSFAVSNVERSVGNFLASCNGEGFF
jgi:hypothetical protein